MQNADRRPIRGFVGLFGIKSLGKAIRRNLGLSMSNYEQIKLTGYPSQKIVYTFLYSHAATIALMRIGKNPKSLGGIYAGKKKASI